VDGDRHRIVLDYTDEWKLADDDRLSWYAELRSRLVERIARTKPDCVVILSLEPAALIGGSNVRMSWFETAEVRGVLAEGARTACANVELRSNGGVTRALNPPRKKDAPKSRPAAEFLKDDSFWTSVSPASFAKKYREAALLALSSMRKV
jgi:hypothetical protein